MRQAYRDSASVSDACILIVKGKREGYGLFSTLFKIRSAIWAT